MALEGMSRGGLIVYNWAAQNPEKVACIYADAPVMDFKSWPMGQGKSAGSAMDTKQLLNAYGFKNEVLIYISTLEILPSSEGFLFNYTYL